MLKPILENLSFLGVSTHQSFLEHSDGGRHDAENEGFVDRSAIDCFFAGMAYFGCDILHAFDIDVEQRYLIPRENSIEALLAGAIVVLEYFF